MQASCLAIDAGGSSYDRPMMSESCRKDRVAMLVQTMASLQRKKQNLENIFALVVFFTAIKN